MFYLISAYRPEYTNDENKARHQTLLQMLQDDARRNGTLSPIECIGCYKGNLEQSIQTWTDESMLLDIANEYGQESILRVDNGQATLIYLCTGGREENIGKWVPTSGGVARAQNSYTFDTKYGCYYVVESESSESEELVNDSNNKGDSMMQVTRTVVDNVPVGLFLVTFETIWGAPCNSGEHDDCGEHGCDDNEPTYIADIEPTIAEITTVNYLTLPVDVTDQTIDLNADVDGTSDSHDLRPRLFATKEEADAHVAYTVERFNNPQPWEIFVKTA